MSELADLVRLGRRALKAGERALLAQVVRVEGSHYRRPGARMILTESGESAGSISAGCLEADLARRLPQVCEGGRPELVEYDTRAAEDMVWGLGLACGGRVTILLTPLEEKAVSRLEQIGRRLAGGEAVRLETPWGAGEILVETLEPSIALWVCGAGPDAAPLVEQAILLGWPVEVFAPRPAAAGRASGRHRSGRDPRGRRARPVPRSHARCSRGHDAQLPRRPLLPAASPASGRRLPRCARTAGAD